MYRELSMTYRLEKAGRAVGASRASHVDVRLIAATHRDLRAAVGEGLARRPPLGEPGGGSVGALGIVAERGYAAIGYPACCQALTPPLSADTLRNPRASYLAA
jgi:sigma-54 interacting transcriptional regulator